MIVPDLDLLIFAYNDMSEFHQEARAWWEELVNGTGTIGIPWQVSNGFVRQMANSRVVEKPWTPAQATRTVAEWFGSDHIVTLDPGPRYLEILEHILATTGATTRLVPDATIAALALENGAEVHTHNARDFQRFPSLLCQNPLLQR
ncbi:MAG: VapC toxin family PIN domain ribonuclease [Chloroflexi bacterium]|nr:VapC toxin family PIN domain ribonuclease [Chloroflexota bacterium]